jgi:hypothetical protein
MENLSMATDQPIESYLGVLERYRDRDPRMVRLTSAEASALTGLAPKTLEAMRAEGRGPRFLKIGRRIAYRLADALNYIEECSFASTREAKTKTSRQRSSV